jgi:hypothetical protein
MSSTLRHQLSGFAVVAAVAIVFTSGQSPAAQTVKPTPTVKPTQTVKPPQAPAERVSVNPDGPAVKAFMDRVNEYVALHKKLEATLPVLSKEATPEQIDKNERALGALIQSARAKAKRGDLFTPEMTGVVKSVIAIVFTGVQGQKLRNSIMDENVKELPLTVNQRFPAAIPMATMPPEILKALPPLPEEMQYRFVASQFVLWDPHANIVADFIPGAIPVK